MSELRKAAQQALEALNLASRNGTDGLKRYELKELDDTITAIRAALAQPEQEPVAWHMSGRGKCNRVMIGEPSDQHREMFTHIQALYTVPPQRKPLSDERVENLMPTPCLSSHNVERWSRMDLHRFARAIETAHGIGGQP